MRQGKLVQGILGILVLVTPAWGEVGKPAHANTPPVPETVTLTGGPYRAVFRKASWFELDYLTAADGQPIPVSTEMVIRIETQDAKPEPPSYRRVTSTADRLEVEYEKDGFLHQHTFAWEGDVLAMRRRISCVRPVRVKGVIINRVTFELPLNRVAYECGRGAAESRLPTRAWTRAGGNWVAADYGEDSGGVSVVFPRRVGYSTTIPGRSFSISDPWHINFPEESKPGLAVEYEIWLAPLKPGPLAQRAAEATLAICAGLARKKSPVLSFFSHFHTAPRGDYDRLLARAKGLALWQGDISEAIPELAKVPDTATDRVALALARGETEPIHLVLTAAEAMKDVSVTCPPLTGEAGMIGANRFRVRYSAYVRVRRTTEDDRDQAKKPARLNYVGVIDDGKKYLETDRFSASSASALGAIEDVLFDRDSVDLEPGHNQPVWITLSLPRDARPGRYRGEIRIAAGDRVICKTPLDVTVWAFTLPRLTSLQTWYQVFPHFLFSPNYPKLHAHWRDYYRDLVEHKVSGFGHIPVQPKLKYVGGKVAIDWSEFDEVATCLFDELGLRCGKLPHGKVGGAGQTFAFAGLKAKTPEYEKALADYMRQAHDHFAERGWLDKMDCYIWDEPQPSHFEVIRHGASIIRKAFPNMRVFCASSHHPTSLVGALNAWCPPVIVWKATGGQFTAESIAEDHKRGDTLWWYNMLYDALGDPVITHRALLWATWREQIEGYFMWTINYWGLPANAWVTDGLGSAMYIYPGLNGPVDSLRWEQTREGLEEYDYLAMLDKALQEPTIPSACARRGRAALTRARALFADPRCLIGIRPSDLAEIRLEVGELLDHIAHGHQ